MCFPDNVVFTLWTVKTFILTYLLCHIPSLTMDVKKMSYGLGLVVVGDSKVGKTCLIQTYGTGEFPEDYEITVGHSFTHNLRLNKERIEVNIHDTGGSREHAGVRHMLYNKADVFIICFSLIDRKTFQHVEQFWLNELRRLRGDIAFVMVGCQSDMRQGINPYHVQKNEGMQLARDLGCHYYECSSVTQRNVKEVFDKAVMIAMDLEPRAMKEDSGCLGFLDGCFSTSDKP